MQQSDLRTDRAVGETQCGKYRLLAPIGHGTSGTVHLARLPAGGTPEAELVAVRVLKRDARWTPSTRAQCLEAARRYARLRHPNVLHTLEAGEERGQLYVAMEYLDGQSLGSLIRRARVMGEQRLLPLELHLHILCEVLAGLAYVHERAGDDGAPLKLVHRELNPQHVLVTFDGEVKVVDFGPARPNDVSTVTGSGVFRGNFAYASPEQLLGRPLDAQSDVFAVGVMLWEALAERRFSTPHPTPASQRARIHGQEPRIGQLMLDIDPWLVEICDRALAVDTYQRYASASVFRRQLLAYLEEQGKRPDKTQLGAAMGDLFAHERRMRRELIERLLDRRPATPTEPLPTIPFRLRTALASARGQVDERFRRWQLPAWSGPFGLGVLAVAVFMATFHLGRALNGPEVPPTITSHSLALQTPAAPPEPSAPELQPVAAEPEPPEPAVTTQRPRRNGAPAKTEPRIRISERGPVAAAREPGPTARATQPKRPGDAEVRVEPPAGSDLRQLRPNRSPKRRIDTEDPYR